MAAGLAIIGAGHAGGRLALQLRKQGWQEPIRLIGDEADPPYERPPLSKEVLSKGADPLVNPVGNPALYAELGIELLLDSPVAALDLATRRLRLADGRALDYGTLVLATGCRARRLPGLEGDNLHLLRSAADARRLAPALQPGARVAILGGGFIGLEIAASAVARGCSVAVVELAPQILGRLVGPEVAEPVAALHRAQGVSLLLGRRVEGLERDGATVRALRLDDGTRLACDLVVVGVGAEANDELAVAAGLACEAGVPVDTRCRTAAPAVYAIGDVTRHENRLLPGRWRLESWENAELQAALLARNLTGGDEDYGCVPWFWTDQYGLNLQLIGVRQASEQRVLRGSLEGGPGIVFYLIGGHVVSACLFNAGRERRLVKRLVEEKVPVEAAALADAARPLKSLLPV